MLSDGEKLVGDRPTIRYRYTKSILVRKVGVMIDVVMRSDNTSVVSSVVLVVRDLACTDDTLVRVLDRSTCHDSLSW